MQKFKLHRLPSLAILSFVLISNFSYCQTDKIKSKTDKLKSFNKVIKEKQEETEDKEITGEVEDDSQLAPETTPEKGINKIVWSNVKSPSGNLSEKDNSVSLKSTLPVYGTAFLSAKLKDLIKEGGNQLFLTVKIDGAKTYFSDAYILVTDDLMGKSFVQFSLVPSLTDNISSLVKNENYTTKEFSELFLNKDPKVYRVTVYFEFSKTDEKIEGSFDYDIAGGIELNQKVAIKLRDGIADLVAPPAAEMKNSVFETQMLALANKYAKDGEKYTSCRITSPDWYIMKNDLGVILERRLAAFLVATYPDGHCQLFKKFYKQSYSGGGNYASQFAMEEDAYGSKRMNCANANK